MNELNKIYFGDWVEVLRTFPDELVNCVVTSPPYWGLRDYGMEGQLGLEKTPEEYVQKVVEGFREVRRVLKKDGTVWLNLGDSYASNWGSGAKRKSSWWSTASGKLEGEGWGTVETVIPPNSCKKWGLKPKDLVGIPWRVAFALQADGWWLRQDIIWAKPNPMPESITDRCTKSHEYIFLLSKSAKYYYDAESIAEKTITNDNSERDRDNTRLNNTPGRTRMGGLKTNDYEFRNKRSVWTVSTKPFADAHFAVFPPELIKPCILAGCPKNGIVLDPFIGSGTTLIVSRKLERNCIGIDLGYKDISDKRIYNELGMFK